MKTIEVRDQVRLPLSRCIDLVLSGLRFRLFRAAITVTIISLAGAFLMTMLGEGLIARQVADVINVETAPRNTFVFWVTRLKDPLMLMAMSEELAAAKPGDDRWSELAAWGGLDEKEMEVLNSVAKRQAIYLTYFEENLDEGQRRILVGPSRNTAIFVWLQDPERLESFRQNLRTSSRQLPTSMADFEQFLKDWKGTEGARRRILEGNASAVRRCRQELLKNKNTQQVLAKADENLVAQLHALGFRMPLDILPLLREQAQFDLDAKKMIELFLSEPANKPASAKPTAGVEETQVAEEPKPENKKKDKAANPAASSIPTEAAAVPDEAKTKPTETAPAEAAGTEETGKLKAVAEKPKKAKKVKAIKESADEGEEGGASGGDRTVVTRVLVKNLLATRIGKDIAKVDKNMLYEETSDSDGASWFSEVTASEKRFGLSPDRIRQVARNFLDQAKLSTVKDSVEQVAGAGGYMGFSSRTVSLILVSFLVCIVGIANAMLMSVTERFREIATMKCLGATDGFIMINFVLESMMQGAAGGAIGVFIGFLLGTLRAWGSYGWLALTSYPTPNILAAAAVAMAMSVVISALAAVYPAYVAARLAPMEAMRIE